MGLNYLLPHNVAQTSMLFVAFYVSNMYKLQEEADVKACRSSYLLNLIYLFVGWFVCFLCCCCLFWFFFFLVSVGNVLVQNNGGFGGYLFVPFSAGSHVTLVMISHFYL